MRALWLENRKLRLREDVPPPEVLPNEALVRVSKTGICSTDLEMVAGYYPFSGILGHEFVGIVEQGPGWLLGQRVVGEINTWCGDCPSCRKGLTTHCRNRTVLGLVDRHGAFAEYLTLPVENLHLVPDKISTEAAIFTEPLAAALRIQSQISLRPDDQVLVVGNGKLGQLIAQTLILTGCQVQLVGRRPINTQVLESREITTLMVEEVERAAYDVVVECAGNPTGFDLAVQALRPRGKLVMKSTYASSLDFDASTVVVKELTLLGSRCGPFAPALDLLAKGVIEVTPLVEARYPLDKALAAFEHARQPGTLKVVVEVAENSS